MIFFSKLIFIVFTIGASLPMWAATIEGRVHIRNNSKYLYSSNGFLKLGSYSFDIQNEITRLKHGDFISGTGNIDHSENSVILDSISSIGLVSILGLWRTPEWDIFEFRDFSHLNLYMAQSQSYQPLNNYGFKPIRYSISPNNLHNTWSILMVDTSRIEVGRLVVKKGSQIAIEILDQNTGRIIQSVDLYQIPKHK